jgi:hypothetical protein
VIVLSIQLVVFGLVSLRGAGRVFSFFSNWFNGGLPCHTVVQNWILRLGLYKLRQAPERRDDWVFILDHTIEFGTKKCLLVLGITLEKFRKNNCIIRHCDVVVLGIFITEKADAESVAESLQHITQFTGFPVQVISDKGSNIKKGNSNFIENADCGFTIRQTYDVTHKAALVIEHQLKDDKNWKKFIEFVSNTKRNLVHTSIAFLAPPKTKEKSRWMNLDSYINWAEYILAFNEKELTKEDEYKFNEKLSWLKNFKKDITEWKNMLAILNTLQHEVKTNGFSDKTKSNFEKLISPLKINNSTLLINIKNEAIKYIENECDGLSGDAYQGTSDIIESILGKYKIFSARSPMKEVGKTVLTIPVFTSVLDYDEVKKAMETVSANDVEVWIEENIGESLFSKRKQAFSLIKTKSENLPVNIFSNNHPKAASF